MAKVGEITAQLKEIKVTMEYAERSKQRAETEWVLAKEKAERSYLEVKRLQLMVYLKIKLTLSVKPVGN